MPNIHHKASYCQLDPWESFFPACQEFSTMSLEFVWMFYLSLVLFSAVIFRTAMYSTSSPSLTTMTSSAGVFDVLAKYFNIFTAFRTRYEYFIMVNRMDYLICWLVYTCHVHLHSPQFPRWRLMLGTYTCSYLTTKLSGDDRRHLSLIPIFEIVWYPVGIQVKQCLVSKTKF